MSRGTGTVNLNSRYFTLSFSVRVYDWYSFIFEVAAVA